ncbi:MAG: NFACT family protein [Candidatus Aenigmarchaeota archaeon]|nr:NFACT family protein [Candidatus Aenigmarchaeota archaeon]
MEEKQEISSLDLRFLVRELRDLLVNGFIRKIYQYRTEINGKNSHQFMFDIFTPGKGGQWLYFDKNKIFLTTYKQASPMVPPSFCLFLRKHLNNKKILDVRQHDFDRIVEIRTQENTLIIELFSDGNVILLDGSSNIIMPLYVQRWKDRDVKPRIPYAYPPTKVNPFIINLDYFVNFLKKYESKLIAILASGFGLGPVYANEICVRAGIDGQTLTTKLGLEGMKRVYDTILSLGKIQVKPSLYDNFVSPFPLESTAKKPSKTTGTFSECLDEYFSEQKISKVEEKQEEIVQEQVHKVERIIENQEKAVEKWTEKREEKKETGNIIYKFYGTVEGVIDGIQNALSSGLQWGEIKRRITSSATPEAEAIKEIRENEGIVVLELGGKDVEIDFRRSVEENAANYYEGSKTAKRKIIGAEKALEETKERLEKIPEQAPPVVLQPKPVKKRKRTKWFEKFRYFRSSDGFIVVGGKDASSNETLIKKHAETGDLVFHSDIQGAPFIVIKSEGRDISNEAKKEAAEFAAAYSKAWQMGLGSVDVYAVLPDQVSKQPPSGEYLPKGSFMIYGQREWFREVELKLSIGMKYDPVESEALAVSGPVMSIRKQTNYFLTLKPGAVKATDLAQEIRNKILIKASPEDKQWIESIPLDEISKLVPSGQGEVIEYGV